MSNNESTATRTEKQLRPDYWKLPDSEWTTDEIKDRISILQKVAAKRDGTSTAVQESKQIIDPVGKINPKDYPHLTEALERSTEQAEAGQAKHDDMCGLFPCPTCLQAEAPDFHAQALAIVKRHAAEADVDEALVDDIARELEMASVGSALLPDNAFLEALADEPVDLAAAEQPAESAKQLYWLLHIRQGIDAVSEADALSAIVDALDKKGYETTAVTDYDAVPAQPSLVSQPATVDFILSDLDAAGFVIADKYSRANAPEDEARRVIEKALGCVAPTESVESLLSLDDGTFGERQPNDFEHMLQQAVGAPDAPGEQAAPTIAEFEAAEGRVNEWLQTEGRDIAKAAAIKEWNATYPEQVAPMAEEAHYDRILDGQVAAEGEAKKAREMSADAIQQRAARARDVVSALCRGEREWKMSIPAQPNDPDVILDDALRDLDYLVYIVRHEDAPAIDPASLSAERCAEILRTIKWSDVADWIPAVNGQIVASPSRQGLPDEIVPVPCDYVLADAQVIAAYYLEHGLVREGEAK